MAKGVQRSRIRDVPIISFDGTQKSYFLPEGVLSELAGFIPAMTLGYKRAERWSAHYDPGDDTLLGVSPVGVIVTGTDAQITAAKKTLTSIGQGRVLANGTYAGWGGPNTFGANQDVTRDRIIYHRKGQNEYTLGWDPSIDPDAVVPYHCHLFHSAVYPATAQAWGVGKAHINHSVLTATPATTGGHMAAGYVRIYLVYYGDSQWSDVIGPIDHVNTLYAQTTSNANRNKITVTDIPTTTWPGVTYVRAYRTRVCSTQQQCDIEPAYLITWVANGVSTLVLSDSDTDIDAREQLNKNKYNFPGLYHASYFKSNLGLTDHLERLVCWGVGDESTLYISGYTDYAGNPVIDDNWWQYLKPILNGDTILKFVSFRGKGMALGRNGIYRLRDDDTDPDVWSWEQMAEIRGESISGAAIVGSDVFILGRGMGGEWDIWACDGYNLKPIGRPVVAFLNASAGIISVDGMPVLTESTTARKYAMNQNGVWGKTNIPSGTKWGVGRYSTFRSGAAIVADADGIYYEDSSYGSDSSDYVISRSYSTSSEDRLEWEKVIVHATKVTSAATLTVQGRVNAGTWETIGIISVIATSDGVYELNIPPILRHGRTLQIKIIVGGTYQVTIEGLTVQTRVVPIMV